MKKILCGVCGARIDRGDCENKYAILTTYNNQSSPRRIERIYLCRFHAAITEMNIRDLKYVK